MLITPTEEFPPATLSTDQVTEGFEIAGKLALNCCVAPAMSVAEAGETELVLVTVTAELALFVVSATLVAVTVCVPATGGAVYRPVASINPLAALPPTTASTDQVTAVFVVPVTLAVNCMVVAAAMFTEVCWIEILTEGGGGGGGGGVTGFVGGADETLWHPLETKATARTTQREINPNLDEAKFKFIRCVCVCKEQIANIGCHEGAAVAFGLRVRGENHDA